MKEWEKRFGTLSGWGAAAVAIPVWGVTFANTRVLLEGFSALEINILCFGLAWLALWCVAASASGVRCRRKAAPECLYCRQHVAAAKKASARNPCGFIGDDGVRCSAAPQANARYCEKHMPRDEKERAE
jgi:hypothetical protein